MSTTSQNTTICPHCYSESEYSVNRHSISIDFRGKKYQVMEEVAVCGACNGEFEVLNLLDPLESVFAQYRIEHGYPSSDQIKQLRKQMGLTEEQFGLVIGTNHRTIRLYENGSLPQENHAEQLKKLINDQLLKND